MKRQAERAQAQRLGYRVATRRPSRGSDVATSNELWRQQDDGRKADESETRPSEVKWISEETWVSYMRVKERRESSL